MSTAATAFRIGRSSPAARSTRVAKPSSAADILRIVRDTRSYPSPLRPIGAGTAQTRCADASGGTQVDMRGLDRILRLDATMVTVQPGITIAELADALGAKGLELIGGFDIANRTVGGAVSAAGLEAASAGSLDTFVSSIARIKFISADGKKYCVDDTNQSLLTLMRFSYGLLGIIYEVTLRVRPIQAFRVRTASWQIEDLAMVIDHFRTMTSGVKLKIYPFRDQVHCEFRDSSDTAEAGARLAWRIKAWTVNSALPGAAFALAKMVPLSRLRYGCIDSLERAADSFIGKGPFSPGSTSTQQKTQTGFMRNRLFSFSSWLFNENDFPRVAAAYRDFCRSHFAKTGYRCDMPTVSYRMPKDRSSLFSPSFDGTMMSITPMATRQRAWDDFAFEFSEFAIKHAGVPIFSQTRHLPPEHVAKCAPQRLAFFRKVRRQLDRDDRFLNAFFANYMLD